jgi:hypothetical protein
MAPFSRLVNLTRLLVIDRRSGMSLTTVAKRHNVSRASVCRLMKEANSTLVVVPPSAQTQPLAAAV